MERKILRAGYGEIIDYLQGAKPAMVHMGFVMPYMLEVALRGITDKERLVILVDVLLSYKGEEVENILREFYRYRDVIENGRVCDIPLVDFARLNSEEVANALLALGCPDEKTKQSENKELVKATAALFCPVPDFVDALRVEGFDIIEQGSTKKK